MKQILTGMFMSDTRSRRGATFRQMIEKFVDEMVSVHGFMPAEARRIATNELQRGCDERAALRRSRFSLIQNDKPG
jgi:hypothetical protein